MDQRQEKFKSIVDGLFFGVTLNVLQPKVASFTVRSLRGVSYENLKELSKRLGTDNIDVIGVKDEVTVIVKNLPASQKWIGFKSKKV
jgi:transcription antitermination factor NusA-like protein